MLLFGLPKSARTEAGLLKFIGYSSEVDGDLQSKAVGARRIVLELNASKPAEKGTTWHK